MSNHNPNRVHAGVREGGQFATGARGESGVSLLEGPGPEIAAVQQPPGGWGEVDIAEGARTPWGQAQTVTRYGQGIVSVSTAGHGGIKLSPARNRQVPPYMRSGSGWYEEDVDAAIPIAVYPEAFATPSRDAEQVREGAISTIRNWRPEDYEKLTGQVADDSNSFMRREEAKARSTAEHRAAHSGEFVTLGNGLGTYHHPWVPEGYSVCEARLDDTGEQRSFLMPNSEVIKNGSYGHHALVDPARHVDVTDIVDINPTWHPPGQGPKGPHLVGSELGVHTSGLSAAARKRAERELSTYYRFRAEDDTERIETLQENIERTGLVGKQRIAKDSGATGYYLSREGSRIVSVSKATFDAVTGVKDQTRPTTDARMAWDRAEKRVERARADFDMPKARKAEADRDAAYTTYRQAADNDSRISREWQAERDQLRQSAWGALVADRGLDFA